MTSSTLLDISCTPYQKRALPEVTRNLGESGSLQLATGCKRQDATVHELHLIRPSQRELNAGPSYLMYDRTPLAGRHVLFDFAKDDNFASWHHRECDVPRAYTRYALNRLLQDWGICVPTMQDDEVIVAAGDVEPTVLIGETQIAG